MASRTNANCHGRLPFVYCLLPVAYCLPLVAPAWGQPAIAVQLPTFSTFGLGTTLSVPNRGAVYLGGVTRSRSDLRESGVPLVPSAPLRNRASSGEASVSGASVKVYVHDFRAMDEAMGVTDAGRGTAAEGRLGRSPSFLGDTSPRSRPSPLVLSPAENARQRPLVPIGPQQEAENLYGLGVEAQSQGNLGAAKVFFEMAARRATGELRERAFERLQAVSRRR